MADETNQNEGQGDLPGMGDLVKDIVGDQAGGDSLPGGEDKATTTPPSEQDKEAQTSEKKPDSDDLLFADKSEEGEEGETEEGESKDKSDDDKASDEKDGEKDDDGEKSEDDAPDEKVSFDYEKLDVPDDMPIPDDLKEKFVTIVSDTEKPRQEMVQELVDMHVDMMHKANDAWFDAKDQWRQETVNDPDIGGQNIKASISKSNEVISAFVSDNDHLEALQSDLKFLGLGNKLSFIKFLNNIHGKISEDDIGGSFTGKTKVDLPIEKRLWPEMN